MSISWTAVPTPDRSRIYSLVLPMAKQASFWALKPKSARKSRKSTANPFSSESIFIFVSMEVGVFLYRDVTGTEEMGSGGGWGHTNL